MRRRARLRLQQLAVGGRRAFAIAGLLQRDRAGVGVAGGGRRLAAREEHGREEHYRTGHTSILDRKGPAEAGPCRIRTTPESLENDSGVDQRRG